MKAKITSASVVRLISPTNLAEYAGNDNKTQMIKKNKDRKMTKAQPQLKARHIIKDVPKIKTYDINGQANVIEAMSKAEDNEQVNTNHDKKPPCHINDVKALKKGTKRKCSHCTQRTATINARRQKPDKTKEAK